MEILEIEECLKSMIILVDTREQPSERANRRYKSFGCSFRRQKLNYGDYAYSFTLPDGSELFDENASINPDVIIERKKDLEELSQCLCQSRDRFRAEFERASEHHASIYLLIENGSWEKLIRGRYNTKFNPNAYKASLIAWMIRYDIKIIFCQQDISGEMIKDILYRELKARLESGCYG